RESDIYEQFARRPANIELNVRSNWTRKIELESGASTQLAAFVDGLPEAARFSVTIAAAPGSNGATAELSLPFSPVTLCRPHPSPAPDLPDGIRLTVVDVRELPSNEYDGEPIHWRLPSPRAGGGPKRRHGVVRHFPK